MTKFFNYILVTLLSVAGFGMIPDNVSAAVLNPPKNLESKSGIAVDVDTGQIITKKNENERLPIASLSKLIVIYMVEDEIAKGNLNRNQQVQIPSKIIEFSHDSSIANTPLYSNRVYSITDLEKAALLPSSNSAALELAELVSGSQKQFYKDAEKLLGQWHINNTNIYSASGLRDGDLGLFNDSSTPDSMENKLSAREVAIVARKLVAKYPNILNLTQLERATFPSSGENDTTLTNTNKLLGKQSDYNIKGLKTGTSPFDGVNFVGYASIKNRSILTVTLNAPMGYNFVDTLAILNEINSNTRIDKIKNRTSINIYNAKVKKGNVTLKGRKNVYVYRKVNDPETKLVSKIRTNTDKITKPMDKHTTLATQKLKFANQSQNDYLEKKNSIEYQTTKRIERANFIVSFFRRFMS